MSEIVDVIADVHSGLHSEHGALRGERPSRSRNPVIRVHDIAWLQFDKTDLVRAESFARAFGFQTVLNTGTELQLRGTDPGAPCLMVRRGPTSRLTGVAFRAADEADVVRLAERTGAPVHPLPESLGGMVTELRDPSGMPVRVVAGLRDLPSLPGQQPHTFNIGHEVARVNVTQRPRRVPARVQRLGHVVMQSTKHRQALDWYLHPSG
jgi:hypothetical protein